MPLQAITGRINKNRKPGDRISYRQVCRIAKGESRHNTVTVQRLTDLLELPEKVPSTAEQDDGRRIAPKPASPHIAKDGGWHC